VEGVAEEETQEVARSTAAREAYFVDFAKAMQAEVNVPLMVTGGFRTRAAMEQALDMGAADMIGLGRPLCVVPDAPKQLFEGRESLPRFEDGLGLLPALLSGLRRFKAVKAVDSFAGIYWFYQQIWLLAHEGRTDEGLPVFKTFRIVDKRGSEIMKRQRNMNRA